jgi:hypothetical protein
MIEINNKSFWIKSLKWPIDNLRITSLSEQNHYRTLRVNLYGRGSMPSSVIVRKCNFETKRCTYDYLMLKYFNQNSSYPSPRLYYAKDDDAKKESILVIEDLHTKFKSFESNYSFSSKEENIFFSNLALLNKTKIKKGELKAKLSFMTQPIYTQLMPLEVLASIEKLIIAGIINQEQGNLLKTTTLPYLGEVIKVLSSLPLRISIRLFSPDHIVIDKNETEAIFVNYNYFGVGNCLDTFVAIEKSLRENSKQQSLNAYIKRMNFKNNTEYEIVDLLKIIRLSHALSIIINWDYKNKKTINKSLFDSLMCDISLAIELFNP